MDDQPLASFDAAVSDPSTVVQDGTAAVGENSQIRKCSPCCKAQPSSSGPVEASCAEEIAVALGEHAALILHYMEKRFDHTLARIERLSKTDPSRNDTAGPAPGGPDSAEALSPLPPKRRQSASPLIGAPIAQFRRYDDWVEWRYHQSVKMHPGGTVEICQDRSTPGVATKPIAIESGGLYRLTIEVDLIHDGGGCRLHARLVGDGGVQLGPDALFANGKSEIFVFAPARTRELALYLIVWEPKIGYTFRLKGVVIEKIDPDSYYEVRVRSRSREAIASLATIPSRREMLADCVASLLLQCEKVRVFLNNYLDVPPVLLHPRVEIRRSQDWDDRGDAGKFGWLGSEGEAGYRIIADDDLIFPVDFVEKMTSVVADHDNRAIAGVHGILLKQPIKQYYASDSRSAFYFAAPLTRERTVHVLGTNALCYHSSTLQMRWADFMYPNMADIFLAKYAQKNSIPMVVVARAQHWVQQNTQKQKYDTIFEHSSRRSGSPFDSSGVQDAVIKWMAPVTLQPSIRPKVVLAIIAWNADDFKSTFESWYRTRWLDFDWVVVVAPGTDGEELRHALNDWHTDHEMHLVEATGSTPQERINQVLALIRRIGFRAAILIASRVEFVGGAWVKPIVGILENATPRAVFAGSRADSQKGSCWCGTDPNRNPPAVVMLNSALAEILGDVDLAASDPMAALRDWMYRAATASSLPILDDPVKKAVTDNLHIDRGAPASAATTDHAATRARTSRRPAGGVALTLNEVFQSVLTINLDRRPDRWATVRRRLADQGVETARFPGVDGTAPTILADYETYRRRPLVAPPESARPVRTSWEYYQDYDSQTARIAHIEQTTQAKAIQSPGAWGYLRTWESILEQALNSRVETLLVFDDDIILHRRGHEIFAAALGGLPTDWLILQLGTLQYHWESDWITWRSPFLYSTNGSAIGSHAVGLRFEIIPYLLDQVRRMELPFDTGALSAATHAFRERCFVTYPNIAIQSLQDSDIGTSEFQEVRAQTDLARAYRWHLEDYAILSSLRFVGAAVNPSAPATRILLKG